MNQKNGDSTNQKDDESQTGIRVSPTKMSMCLLKKKLGSQHHLIEISFGFYLANIKMSDFCGS